MHRRRNSSWKLHCVRLMPNLQTEKWEHCILENRSKSFFENFPKENRHIFFLGFCCSTRKICFWEWAPEYWQNLWCFERETTHKATLTILRSSVVINMVSNPTGYVNARKAFKTYKQRVNTFQGFRWQVTLWKQIDFKKEVQPTKESVISSLESMEPVIFILPGQKFGWLGHHFFLCLWSTEILILVNCFSVELFDYFGSILC